MESSCGLSGSQCYMKRNVYCSVVETDKKYGILEKNVRMV